MGPRPKLPEPIEAPATARPTDPAILEARRLMRQKARKNSARRQTLLTGPKGTQLGTSTVLPTLLGS